MITLFDIFGGIALLRSFSINIGPPFGLTFGPLFGSTAGSVLNHFKCGLELLN